MCVCGGGCCLGLTPRGNEVRGENETRKKQKAASQLQQEALCCRFVLSLSLALPVDNGHILRELTRHTHSNALGRGMLWIRTYLTVVAFSIH